MTKFFVLSIKILITLPVIAWLFFLTLSNRNQSLGLTWSPFHEGVSIQLPLILFLGLAAGFIWGALIMWSNTLYLRVERRELRKKMNALEQQLDIQRKESERLSKGSFAPVSSAPAARIAAPDII